MDNTNDLVCPICGQPTSVYINARKDRLCRAHAKDFKEGLIKQCEDCGKWIKSNETCECKCKDKRYDSLPTAGFEKCVACGEPTNGYAFCRKCYKKYSEDELIDILNAVNSLDVDNNLNLPLYQGEFYCVVCGNRTIKYRQCKTCLHESLSFYNTFDKNSSSRQFRDHYFNLKERILIMNNFEESKIQCNRLIAIAMLNNSLNSDSALLSRVYTDVDSLIQPKYQKSLPIDSFAEKKKEEDQKKSKIFTCEDGHNVDSDYEMRIDNMLYSHFILHSYGKNIDEFDEARKKCDWFIPIQNGKGIYIEYWGMDTEKYLKDRKEKEELYKKYDTPYLGIEKDDPKHDFQTFVNNFLRDLRKLAKDRFGFMPEWK